eukprot:349770-Chlamydomonas_euryale.AAC.8
MAALPMAASVAMQAEVVSVASVSVPWDVWTVGHRARKGCVGLSLDGHERFVRDVCQRAVLAFVLDRRSPQHRRTAAAHQPAKLKAPPPHRATAAAAARAAPAKSRQCAREQQVHAVRQQQQVTPGLIRALDG